MEKKIISAIPLNGTLYNAGMEKELGEVLTAEQVKHLTEQGAVEGFDGKAKQTGQGAQSGENETQKQVEKETKQEEAAGTKRRK